MRRTELGRLCRGSSNSTADQTPATAAMQRCLQRSGALALQGYARAQELPAVSRLAVSILPGCMWSSALAFMAAP